MFHVILTENKAKKKCFENFKNAFHLFFFFGMCIGLPPMKNIIMSLVQLNMGCVARFGTICTI